MSGRGDGGALVQVERRRNWSDEEKLAILKETTVPGVVTSAVARRHGIGTGQLYTWRKQLLRGAMAGFVPVELAASSPSAKAREAGRIEVRGRCGLTVSVDGEVDRAALKQVLDVLRELDHCQSACKRDPLSARKRDPLSGWRNVDVTGFLALRAA